MCKENRRGACLVGANDLPIKKGFGLRGQTLSRSRRCGTAGYGMVSPRSGREKLWHQEQSKPLLFTWLCILT